MSEVAHPDFEFLDNLTGDPYILHTNVFAQEEGSKEQQFYLWFDPTADFHTYTILWNPKNILFYIDGAPFRAFRNHQKEGFPFPTSQLMRMYSSLWDAEDWATRGGLVKTDWSKAPFTASYQKFSAEACVSRSYGGSSCSSKQPGSWFDQELDSVGRSRLEWVKKNYMIYNYCADLKRFPQGQLLECSTSLS